MKKDPKKSGNEPFYSKFQHKDTNDRQSEPGPGKSRREKKSDTPAPKRARTADKPVAGPKKAADKPFGKPASRYESNEKPTFRKRTAKDGDTPPRPERKPDRPFDREKRNGDRPVDKRGPRTERDEKPGFRKAFDPKSELKPRPEKRTDKPAEKYVRGEEKPWSREKRGERPAPGDKPDFKKPFDKKSDFKPRPTKNFDKPAEKRPRSYDKSETPEQQAKDSERRRAGDFKEAPRYDFRQAEERYVKKSAPKPADESIRLNKYIANAGLCSRREADGLIETGQITINGKVVTELGYKVYPGEVVKYGNRVLNPEKMVYILVNKPKDFITTTDDPEGRHTVMELIAGACKERVYPVGRLDRNTTGLLLLTNDGELAEKLMHPSNEIQKIYQAELDKPLTTADFEKIKEGLELEDGPIRPDDLAIVTPDAMVVGIEIHSGRNRIVRRIFESLGYEVLKLDRTVYAGLTKKELPRGKWRFLNEKEVVKLKYLL